MNLISMWNKWKKSCQAMGAALVVLGTVAVSQGAIIVWDNGAGTLNWGDAANWNPNGVPAANNQIQFNGTGVGSAQVASGATVTMAGVAVYGANPTTTEVDLKNGADFTINIGASNNFTYFPTIKVQDAFDYTLLSGGIGALAITGTTTVDVVSGGSLTVDGGFTVSAYGTGVMIKTGAGTMFLTGGKPANASTVNMNVQGGILSTSSVNNLGTGYLAAQSGGTFQYTGAGAETKTGVLHWNVGPATFDITQSSANLTFAITGGTRDQAFTKAGPGTLTLQGGAANGPVTLSGGTLVYRNAVGTNPSSIPLNGAFEIHSNTLDLNPNAFTIPTNNGIVRFRADTGRIIRLQSTVNIDGGKIQIAGAGTTRNDALTANWSSNTASLEVLTGATFDIRGNQVWVNALIGDGSVINSYYQANSGIVGHTLTVGVDNGSGTFSGVISGTGTSPAAPGQISLIKTGTGTQTFTGANTYAGTTTVSGGTLELGAGGSIANTASVSVGITGSGTGDTLTLNNPGTHRLGMGDLLVGVSEVGAVNHNAGIVTVGDYDAALENVRIGAGAAGVSTYTIGNATLNVGDNGTGNVNLGRGNLSVGHTSAGSLTVNNGAVINTGDLLVGSGATSGTVTQNGGTINVFNNSTYILNAGDPSGTAIVNQSGGTTNVVGGMVLGNGVGVATQNQYNLSGGTLDFGDTAVGTQILSGTPSTLTVNSDGQFNLSGTGVLMNVTNIDPTNGADLFTQGGGTLVVGVDGSLNPATAVRATTNILGNFTQTAGTIKIDIFGADGVYGSGEVGNFPAIVQTDSDLLNVLGNLTLDGTLAINTNGVQPPAFGWYDVAYANTITINSGFNLTGIGLYQVIDNPNGPGQILQVAAPEPAAIAGWTLAALVGVGLFWRTRRRGGQAV